MHSLSDPTEGANTAPTPEAGPPAGKPPENQPPEGANARKAGDNPDPLVHFALRSDGAILLNAADLRGFDLSGREVFVGIVLTPRETRFALFRLGNAAADAASNLLASLLKSLSRLSS